MSIFRQTTRMILCMTILLLHTSCFQQKNEPIKPTILPIPVSQNITGGHFTLNSNTQLVYETDFKQVAEFLKSYLENGSTIKLKATESAHKISFLKDKKITNKEGYELTVSKTGITISASTATGAFYGVQSLRQLIPIQFENGSYEGSEVAIQNIEIKDAPQFKYRGMHLDVGRHFFSVDFIKKYIDMMSMLKMNTFHWHLTEDQGWRIEIKKYPKLNEIAAYRKETLIGHYSDQPQKYDGKEYGGYYTQEQVKDIVKYAGDRQIDVIPEIEMPGHSVAAISAYPELGCTGKQIDVATKWGIFDDIYCTKESTFKFLENVLDEVMELFPSKYIHIGGDEAPKTNWKSCPNCQKLIKKEGLKDEHGLQSYFITRMEKYINSKGKQIIGWDEILEGGLAPNATVMSWRGINGAVTAAKQHHDVILTPGSHCYFDHYQSTNENEPVAIGGFLPLEKVYSFNPIPAELTKEESKYVLGAQGNVWTEYMQTEDKVEYMMFPRIVALSEVVWSKPENKDYESFKSRLIQYQKRLDMLDVNYANHLYEISGKLNTNKEGLSYTLEASSKDQSIRYTTDGTVPTIDSPIYSEPISLEETSTIKAASFNTTKIISSVFSETITTHKAVGKKVTLSIEPNSKYNAGGAKALINGISGNNKRYGDKEWLGFDGEDVEITIDLEKETAIKSISMRFHNGKGQWIYAPKSIEINIDGTDKPVIKQLLQSTDLLVNFNVDLNTKARFITLKINNYGVIPDGKQGAGHKAWLFVDEIIVE
ncbi:MAG: hexosaminidase [Polaribacter sp.]|jgi:hexosaminidase